LKLASPTFERQAAVLGDHMIAGWSSWRFLLPSRRLLLGAGPESQACRNIPNMTIKNSDVIAQAVVRLHLRKACTLPRKARRANAILGSRVSASSTAP
jgi:hypothetical protein